MEGSCPADSDWTECVALPLTFLFTGNLMGSCGLKGVKRYSPFNHPQQLMQIITDGHMQHPASVSVTVPSAATPTQLELTLYSARYAPSTLCTLCTQLSLMHTHRSHTQYCTNTEKSDFNTKNWISLTSGLNYQRFLNLGRGSRGDGK